MNPGSAEDREFTYYGVIPAARVLLITLYGSYESYLLGSDYVSKYAIEEACILYSRAIEQPVCSVAALKLIDRYDYESGDDAFAKLHFELHKIVTGEPPVPVQSTCTSCIAVYR